MHCSHEKFKWDKGTVDKIGDNILDHNFIAEAPNEIWVIDITEFKLYG